jgi:hypothetical protein
MRPASIVSRVIALAVVLYICFAIGSGVAMRGIALPAGQSGSAALYLILVCALEAAVLSYLVLRSRWFGWRLVLAITVIFYGVATFMGQIESAVFLTHLPSGMLPRLFLMGALVAMPSSALAVVLLGKRKGGRGKRDLESRRSTARLVMPANDWAWRLAVIAVAYVILYFTFGYFIAWRNPAVREYYGGGDPGSFFAQMGNVVRDTPWLIPFQILRSMCWAAIALPIVRMLKGDWRETALALAVTFSVLMNAQLLLPNPFMPEPVRVAHLVETASSNFIFGLILGWLLTERSSVSAIDVAPGLA